MNNWLGFRRQNVDSYRITDSQRLGNRPDCATPSAASRQAELAGCDIRYAIFFSMLLPFVGYSYTGRFKAFGVFVVSGVVGILGLSFVLSEQVTQSEKLKVPLSLSLAAISAADNSRAILSARRAVKNNP